jgi:hypothetical protein
MRQHQDPDVLQRRQVLPQQASQSRQMGQGGWRATPGSQVSTFGAALLAFQQQREVEIRQQQARAQQGRRL